jgi:hypothetical protein
MAKKKDPVTIVTQHEANFNTLKKAFANNQVCLMDCVENATGEHVAVICSVYIDEEGQYNMTPFTKFFNGNPYDMLTPPM